MIIAPPRWAEKYVGLAYSAASSGDGVDCWELVRRVLSQEAGVDLPVYGDTTARDLAVIAGLFEGERMSGRWMKVERQEYRAFDVVSLIVTGHETHCGVLVSAHHLLHIEKLTASVIVPLTHPTVRRRIAGVHRHVSLVNERAA